MAAEKKDTKAKTEAKPKRRQRTIEEQIADLQAKAKARADRRRATALKQYEQAVSQRDTHRARLETTQARVDELAAELGLDQAEAEPTD